jgi:protein associated with RNAse G/E
LAQVTRESPLVLHIPAETSVCNPDGSTWTSPYDVEAYFPETDWYNVFKLNKQSGIEWYCNVASPPARNETTGNLEFVDYDLDVYVHADGDYTILDREEYEKHARLMKYPDEVKQQVEQGLAALIQVICSKRGPFDV